MTTTRIDSAKATPTTPSATMHQAATGDDIPLAMTSLLATADNRDELCEGLVAWLNARPGCAGAGFFFRNNDDLTLGPNNFTGPVFEQESFLQSATASADIASRNGTRHSTDVERVRNLKVVSIPVQVGPRKFDTLTAAMVKGQDEAINDSTLLIAATNAALWYAQQQQLVLQNHLQTTAAVIELLRTLQTAETFRAGSIALVNSLREHLQCRGVVLGLTRRGGRCTAVAMSGLADFDAQAVVTHAIEDALNECVARERLSVFPPDDHSNRDSLLSHQKLAHELQAARVISHPLATADGETAGVWLVIEDTVPNNDEAKTLLHAAASPVAEALLLTRRADRSFFSAKNRTHNGLRWLIRITCAAIVITAILMIPLPYQVHCNCAAEPDVRRFIVAPHEGLIEKTFVKPGDVVQQGQLLARMDGRDARWELAGLKAEQEQAKKDQDAGLLVGDIAAAQRAMLELQQLEARQQILIRRRDELELTAPIDGIVLDGHLDRVENAPVTIGQALYEVAPLSPVTVEVAIPHDEHPHVQTGFGVTVRFDGVDSEFAGTIHRIQPRSEVLDGDNVFIAEVVIDNDDDRLRPGMKGYARVTGKTRSLGWSLFHKPWEHLRKVLPF